MKFGKTLTLNNGVEIPQIQLGTWLINNDDVRKTVRQAIDVGYRAFDTAKDYGNERGVGKGIWNSDIERSDIFLMKNARKSPYFNAGMDRAKLT